MASAALRAETIPPLEAGDRLTRAEFERRYEAAPRHLKAELIDGVVYVASPVSLRHGRPHLLLAGWLAHYEAATPSVQACDNVTDRLDEDNEPQPDLALIRSGGRAHEDPDGYLSGPPDLVVEIASSSTAYDLHQKKDVYRRHGVGTYVVWVVRDGTVRWFELVEGAYEARAAEADGVYRSARFPGLWLDEGALREGDTARLLGTLGDGLKAR